MPRLITISLLLALLLPSARALNPVRSFLAQNLLDEAVRICRQFETMGNTDKDNIFACTWVYYRAGRMDSADKFLEKARKFYGLPEYQLLLAMGKLKRKQYDDAKKLAEAVAKEYRGTPIGLTAQELSAEVYEAQGQLDTAAFIYKQVAGDDSKRGRAHWGLGRYYLGRGDTGRARTHLEATAKAWPRHVGSRYNLGVLAMQEGNLAEASKWLSECYRFDKADAGVLEQLGLLFEKKGMINDAVRNWRKAVAVKKDSQIAKEKLAQYGTIQVDEPGTTKSDEPVIKGNRNLAANDPAYLFKRGVAYRSIGRWKEAASDLTNYVDKNPNDPVANRELGICFLNLKVPDRARNYFARAIQYEPANGMNYAWLAYVMEGKGELEAARDAWTKALELLKDPTEIQRANRRLNSVQKRMDKKSEDRRKAEEGED